MQLVSPKVITRSHGVVSSDKFKIEASAKAFSILSSRLYSNKIKAILRELSTNAYDAHLEAGNLDTQFEIHLPSVYNNKFSIRDFGTGMSPEKIESLYSTYFGSDKINSNELNGCLGLGSKSPFAYTDIFTVTSWYDGQKYLYTASINDEGIPTINALSQPIPSSEPTGVEISFAVKSNDIQTFTNEAGGVFSFFAVKPKFVGQATQIRYNTYSPLTKGKNWALIANAPSLAIMGNVAYPIDSKVFEKVDNIVPTAAPSRYQENTQSVCAALIKFGIHLQFDIGEIDFIPSREGLEYNKRTVRIIKERLEEIQGELQAYFSEKFKNVKNLFEARRLYSSLMVGDWKNLANIVRGIPLEYNGTKLTTKINIGTDKDTCIIPDMELEEVTRYSSYGRLSRNKLNRHTNIQFANNLIFLERDTGKNSLYQTRELINKQNNFYNTKLYLLEFQTDKAREDFCTLLGCDKGIIYKVSELPAPPRVKYEVTKEKVFLLKQKDLYPSRNAKSNWEIGQITKEDGGVYVTINRYKINGLEHPKDRIDILRKFESVGIKIPPVIGIKSAAVESFTKAGQWIQLEHYLRKALDEFISKRDISKHIDELNDYSNFSAFAPKYIKIYQDSKISFKKDGLFTQFVLRLQELQKLHNEYRLLIRDVLNLSSICGYNIKKESNFIRLSEWESKILSKYDILQLYKTSISVDTNNVPIVAKYINLEDSK